MHVFFWSCIAIVAYIYFGYPILLASGLLGRKRSVRKGDSLPRISVIIPAHNEESVIESKLDNLLSLDYPAERLEILVGSDGSTDGTDDVVERFAGRGVTLVSASQQRGKSSIQNDLVQRSTGELLVFTDADSQINHEGLRRMAANFHDPEVGLVTVSPAYNNSGETDLARNESAYWRYENWLRRQESDRGLLAAASGWLFGMRRSLWRPLDANVGDDFVLPLQVALQRRVNIVEDGLRVETRLTQVQSSSMFRMKMRIISKDLRGLLANRAVLNVFRTGPVGVALWSHKLLRWFVPYFLLGALLASVILSSETLYLALAASQTVFYGAALAAYLRRDRQVRFPFSLPLAFCLVNSAALLGTLHCVSGRTTGRWKPVR